jgi:SAM-dependent methyltransferase
MPVQSDLVKRLLVRLAPRRAGEDSWRIRPAGTPERYWNSADLPHRGRLLQAIRDLGPIESVLELGCGAGPNLRRLFAEDPALRLAGVDIHADAIEFARARFREIGASVELEVARFRSALDRRAASSEDVICSCYALAYLPPAELAHVLQASLRIARVGVVLMEPHAAPGLSAGLVNNKPEWRHDYTALLADFGASVVRVPMPEVPPDTLNALTVAARGVSRGER